MGSTNKPFLEHPIKGSLARPEFFWATIVFFTALILYTWTLAPTVTLVDSGELIVAARGLGVAHPPGFPVWVMFAHLASLLPFGSVASRLNFSSAIFGAMASAALSLAAAELSPGHRATRPKSIQSSRLLILAPMLSAGLLMAFSRTLWSYATVTEVYTLNTFLLLVIFVLMLRWRHQQVAAKNRSPSKAKTFKPPNARNDLHLYVAAVVFGLALGVHHVTIGLALPALGLIVYRTEGVAFFKSRRLLWAAVVSLMAFGAAYAYLPIAAARAPLISWGETSSAQAIWRHIIGRQYQPFFSFSPSMFAEQLGVFGETILNQFGFAWAPLTLPLAGLGLVSAFKQDRTIFWFLVVIIGCNLLYTLSYDIAEDKDAYWLPVFVAFALAMANGIRAFIGFVLAKSLHFGKIWRAVAIGSLALIVSSALLANWPFNNRRHYFIAHDYVDNILGTIKPNGLLLTLDWQIASPFLYTQEVERRRRDVKVLDINLLRHSWYFSYLRQIHPDLIERSRDKIETYLVELKQWEADPPTYANNPELNARIASKFVEMIQTVVQRETVRGPAYVTQDLVTGAEHDAAIRQWLVDTYAIVPEGLVFSLANNSHIFHEPGELNWQTRGLSDGSLRFEKGDVVTTKVLPAYTSMLVNRGRYLSLFGQQQRAIAAFKQALVLNPNFGLAREGLNDSLSRSAKP